MKIKMYLLFILATAIFTAPASGENGLKSSVVKIFTISNSPSYYQPWQMNGQVASGGSGSIISGQRILTNAHVVSNTTYIEVRKFGGTESYAAYVEAVDHDCDLAILKVKDKAFFKNTTPISIGGTPKQGDTVNVYGYPIGGDELSRTKGVVSRVEVGSYFHSFKSHLNMQIDAPLNKGNSGGPVIKDGKQVGVAFQNYNNAESIGYAIPPEIINHFLNDLKNKKYRGFPTLGFWWQTLENDKNREMLGMKPGQTGIMAVRTVYSTSSWNTIKENDVILSIDGVNISNDGNVPLKSDKSVRVKYTYLTDLKYAGDTVTLKIIRDKKPMTLNIELKRSEDIVPAVEYDVKPEYYIFGGVVFTRLTGNYLREWGDIKKAPIYLTNSYYYDFKTPEKEENVLVIQVLADETTKGYYDNNNIMVEAVNGEKIKSLADLVEKIETNKEKYLVITLFDNSKIILDMETSRKASERILEKYNIKSPISENLLIKVQEAMAKKESTADKAAAPAKK